MRNFITRLGLESIYLKQADGNLDIINWWKDKEQVARSELMFLMSFEYGVSVLRRLKREFYQTDIGGCFCVTSKSDKIRYCYVAAREKADWQLD